METMKRALHLQKRGAVLPLVLTVLAILLIVGTGLLNLSLQSRFFAIRTSSEISARCAADAGLTQAIFTMNEKLKDKVWDDPTLEWITDQPLLNCDATFSYKITAKSIMSNKDFAIASVGRCGRAEKAVYANIGLEGLFEHAILTKEMMIFKSDTFIGGYNSMDLSDTDVEVKIGTISTSPDQIILNNNVTIDGEVMVGIDGNPSTVIKDLGAKTGPRYAMGEEPPLPRKTASVLTAMGTGIYAKGTTLTIGPADSGKYTGIELLHETVKIKGNIYEKYIGILEISGGDVVLHITGDIWLGQACEIIVRDKASLTLYVDGNITCGNDSSLTNEGFPNPKTLQLYATGTGAQDFDIKAKSDWCGIIYAPNASVNLYAKGNGYGSIVADSFEFKAGGDFYYDEALRDVDIGDEDVRFVIKQWREE